MNCKHCGAEIVRAERELYPEHTVMDEDGKPCWIHKRLPGDADTYYACPGKVGQMAEPEDLDSEDLDLDFQTLTNESRATAAFKALEAHAEAKEERAPDRKDWYPHEYVPDLLADLFHLTQEEFGDEAERLMRDWFESAKVNFEWEKGEKK